MTLELQTTVRRAPSHWDAPVHDETIILHTGEGAYYGLNETGTRIWEWVSAPRTVDSLVTGIEQEFIVERHDAERDVIQLIGEMIDCGLIEVVVEGA